MYVKHILVCLFMSSQCWATLVLCFFGGTRAEIATHFKLIVTQKIKAKSKDMGNKM